MPMAIRPPASADISTLDRTIVVSMVFATWFLLFVVAATFAPDSDGITLVFVG
jgi:hypothetical protein